MGDDISWTSDAWLDYLVSGISIHVLAELFTDVTTMPKTLGQKMSDCQMKLALTKAKFLANERKCKKLELSYEDLERRCIDAEAYREMYQARIVDINDYNKDLEKQLNRADSSACFGVSKPRFRSNKIA